MEGSKKVSVEPSAIVGHVFQRNEIDLNKNDVILYALSVGFSQDPLNTDHFKLTYENDENF